MRVVGPRVPGVRRPFAASCVARLPTGAIGLLLVLHTHALTGSYARAGLAAGVQALALGVSNPLLARLVDRSGQTAVLRIGAVVAGLAMVGLALLPDDAPFGAIVALAAVSGAAQPPVGACMRALWQVLLSGRDQRHAAYSLKSVVLEIVYIAGPILIVAGIGAWSLRAAFAACGVFFAAGNLAFSLEPASRRWRPLEAATSHLAGALSGPGVRVLVAVLGLAGLTIGAVEVVVPAVLTPLGQRDLTGIMLGLWGIGSMAGGVISARLGPGARPGKRLAVLMLVWGAAHGVVGLANSAAVLGVLLLLAGASIAPTFVCANGMLDQLAPKGPLTEGFTWIATGLTAGIAGGSALGGVILESASPEVALGDCGAASASAAAIATIAARGALAVTPEPTQA